MQVMSSDCNRVHGSSRPTMRMQTGECDEVPVKPGLTGSQLRTELEKDVVDKVEEERRS